MSAVDNLKEAATVLQEADVSDIVSSLALGIANAQKQLDDNSIKQTLALADPANAINGKSLLQLGFTPAFYHFQYADINAEINLQMKLETSTSFGLSAQAEYERQGGISSENLNFFKETESEVHRDEFRSSRQFLMSASETESVTIQKATVNMNQEEGSVAKVQNFAQTLRLKEDIDRVQTTTRAEHQAIDTGSDDGVVVHNSGAYITVRTPYWETKTWGIFQVANYHYWRNGNAPKLDEAVAESAFTVRGLDFARAWNNVSQATVLGTGGTVMGFTQSGVYTDSQSDPILLQLHFEWDHDHTTLEYHTNGEHTLALKRLAEILRLDTGAKVRVVAHTDSSGKEKYNENLSMRRAHWMRDWFMKHGALEGQIDPQYQDEQEALADIGDGKRDVNYRKVTVELVSSRDYFFFSGGNMSQDATHQGPDTFGNGFLKIQEGGYVHLGHSRAKFSVGKENYDIHIGYSIQRGVKSSFANTERLNTNYSFEQVDDVSYLLSNEATIKHIVFSETTDEIEIETETRDSNSASDGENTIKVDSNQNSLTRTRKISSTVENPNTFAVGGSLDIRTSKQLDVSTSGSSAVSARLVSLPAPPEFLDEVKSFLK
ncbi:MAG: OmpA family protein [Bacteroidota bacterium]